MTASHRTTTGNEVPGTWARDRLQPTLLDRLTDLQPASAKDSSAQLVISRRRLREIVVRDLEWLLNATRCESEVDFSHAAHARRSTINYGLPAFAGRRASDVRPEELEAELRQTIVLFEPRIVADSLQVVGLSSEDAPSAAHNLITFEIRGQVWANPYPIELLVKSSIDLESGAVTLRDQLGAG